MIDEAPLSVPSIVVFEKATGKLLFKGPRNAPIPSSAYGWTPLPTGYNPDTFVWNASAKMMVEDLDRVKANVIAAVKAEAETRKMALLSSGGAKKAEYAEKRQEVISYDALATGVGGIVQALTTLTTPRRKVMLAHAEADAAAHGDTIAAAIERFRGGISRAATTPLIAAAEATACDLIRLATSAAAVRTLGQVKWP